MGISLLLTLAALGSPGCTSSHDTPGADSPQPGDLVQLGFRIRLSDTYHSRSSSTSLSDDYVRGTGYEDYIAGDDYRFMLFDGDGRYVETMDIMGMVPVTDEAGEYNVVCLLSRKPEGEFKVVALANWGSGNYPTPYLGASLADICGASASVYTYVPPFDPTAITPIPMYGVKSSSMTLLPGKPNDLGTINLLRALAKVEVVCSEGSGLELASVTMTGHNSHGFRTPAGMYDVTKYVDTPHIPSDAGTDTDTTLPFTVSADGDRALIYIPEYSNTGAGATPCRITVTFADNPGLTYNIDFTDYRDGRPTDSFFDILRNYYYRFTVDKSPELEVELSKYKEIWLDPIFGMD